MKRKLLLATVGIVVFAALLATVLPRLREPTFPDRLMSWAVALAHEISDTETRVSTLIRIASETREQGDMERTRILLQEAQESLKEMRSDTRRLSLEAEIASLMISAGMLEGALKTVERTKNKSEVLEAIAPLLVKAGRLDKLVELAQGNEAAQSRVVDELVSEGLLDEAMHFARETRSASVLDRARWRIGFFLVSMGRAEEALKVARDIKDDSLRARVLAEVASIFAQRGRDAEAGRLFREAVALATAVAQLGEEAEDPPGYSLNEVVTAMARAGKHREALQVIVREHLDRMFAYMPRAWVAIHMAEHGRLEEALKLARSIPLLPTYYPNARLFALGHIGKTIANAGRYEEALKVAREMGKNGSSVLRAVGEAKMKAGQFEEALALSREMGADGASLQIAICEEAAKYGSYEKAIQLCSRVDKQNRSKATLAIIGQMCRNCDLIDALSLTQSISDTEARDTAFSTIAGCLASAMNFAEAKRALDKVQGTEMRCWTQINIATALAKAGRHGDAEKMFAAAVRSAKGLKENDRRSRALSQVAAAMANVALGKLLSAPQ